MPSSRGQLTLIAKVSEQTENAPTHLSLPAAQSDEFRIFAETAAEQGATFTVSLPILQT